MYPSIYLPVLGHAISTYSVVTSVYVVVGLLLVIALNEKQGIAANTTLALFVIAVPAATLGAHALDMFEYRDRYHSMAQVFSRSGSSIFGALFVGIAVAWMYAVARGLSPLKLLDAGAPVMAFGEAATRIGCFLNGCCYGVEWHGPLAVTFPPESFAFRDQVAHGLLAASASRSLPVHPVQLYSTVLMAGAGLYLLHRFTHRQADGEGFFTFLVLYGLLRLSIAPLRVEALASMKVFSVIFILSGGVGLWACRQRVHLRSLPASG
jgi:phosphatidylglycerol:prolipoprotein diacylglycerol transferase